MKIELKERTRDHVSIYWNKTQDEEIRKMLPSSVANEKEAMLMFEKSLYPMATSYGRVIYLDGQYIGDIWCYGIDEDKDKVAMLSYCIFDKDVWGRGVATMTVNMFLKEVFEKYKIEKIGAFTYSDNDASVRVLEKQKFNLIEEFEEKGIKSKYFEKRRDGCLSL